jgi:hypothetical protein
MMATERHQRAVRRLRLAAILVTLGLVVELVSLRWAHPTAFLVFALGAGFSIACGALLFLSTLLATGPDS